MREKLTKISLLTFIIIFDVFLIMYFGYLIPNLEKTFADIGFIEVPLILNLFFSICSYSQKYYFIALPFLGTVSIGKFIILDKVINKLNISKAIMVLSLILVFIVITISLAIYYLYFNMYNLTKVIN